MKLHERVRVLLVLCAMFVLSAANASERILDFHSEIFVDADAGMRVNETIRVRAEGDRIKHGIYRDFPTAYRDDNGVRVRVAFDPQSLSRDGQTEPYHTKAIGNGVRVYFGAEDTTLAPAEYVYVFAYRTTRQLGFFDDHDELYWNVTGNGWEFPIDSASAAVTLPGSIATSDIRIDGYTGPQGAQGHSFKAQADAASHATFTTTRTLGEFEGLTIVVGFPKGFVETPTQQMRIHWFFSDNAAVLALGGALALLLIYYFVQWLRVGRDPEPGTIIPLYEIPDGHTPGALRYVEHMGWDDRCIAADIVDLAVRGAITIQQDKDDKYSIARATSHSREALPAPQSALLGSLLGESETLVFKQSEHKRIKSALNEHEARLKTTYAKYFNKNTSFVWVGALITAVMLGGAAYLLGGGGYTAGAVFILVWLGGWSVGVFALCAAVVGAWRSAKGVGGAGGALFLTLFALPFIGGELVGAGMLVAITGVAFAIGVVGLIATNMLFGYLMKAPTQVGRKLLDQIEGLRLYLGVAERDELAAQKAPPVDADAFQRMLPCALALGVEKNWTDRFAATVGPAAAAAAVASAGWYQGSSSSMSNFGGFASGFGSSLSSAISSSSSAPGSSSGGGGGGSSGGGGGGGGGGGW